MSEQTPHNDTIELKKLNKWLIVLLVFIIMWSAGLILYVDQKVDNSNNHLSMPVIVIDRASGKINNTNLFSPSIKSKSTSVENKSLKGSAVSNNKTNSVVPTSVFESKDTYNIKEFVVINYFYKSGIVISRVDETYTIMYNVNGKLETITVPNWMLTCPTSDRGIDPFSLIR